MLRRCAAGKQKKKKRNVNLKGRPGQPVMKSAMRRRRYKRRGEKNGNEIRLLRERPEQQQQREKKREEETESVCAPETGKCTHLSAREASCCSCLRPRVFDGRPATVFASFSLSLISRPIAASPLSVCSCAAGLARRRQSLPPPLFPQSALSLSLSLFRILFPRAWPFFLLRPIYFPFLLHAPAASGVPSRGTKKRSRMSKRKVNNELCRR